MTQIIEIPDGMDDIDGDVADAMTGIATICMLQFIGSAMFRKFEIEAIWENVRRVLHDYNGIPEAAANTFCRQMCASTIKIREAMED